MKHCWVKIDQPSFKAEGGTWATNSYDFHTCKNCKLIRYKVKPEYKKNFIIEEKELVGYYYYETCINSKFMKCDEAIMKAVLE